MFDKDKIKKLYEINGEQYFRVLSSNLDHEEGSRVRLEAFVNIKDVLNANKDRNQVLPIFFISVEAP